MQDVLEKMGVVLDAVGLKVLLSGYASGYVVYTSIIRCFPNTEQPVNLLQSPTFDGAFFTTGGMGAEMRMGNEGRNEPKCDFTRSAGRAREDGGSAGCGGAQGPPLGISR